MTTKIYDRENAIAFLKGIVNEGDTVYTVIRGVSASGMSRSMDLFVVRNNQILRITSRVVDAIGGSWDKKRCCLRVSGCGMDMGFAVVYDLASVLFQDGYKLRQEWL